MSFAAVAAPLSGQTFACARCRPVGAPPITSDATLIAVNSLLGGVTAGVLAGIKGKSFLKGFAAGAAGGALVYAGKRVVTQPFEGSGLVGRQVAAVGNSFVQNGANGRPVYDELIVMLGPIPGRLFVSPTGETKLRPVLDLVSFGGLLYGIFDSRYSFQWGSSWSSGAAVFVDGTPVERSVDIPIGVTQRTAATTAGGNIFLTPYASVVPGAIEHERVHVLQFDFTVAAWGDPVDSAILAQRAAGFDRYVKLNLLPAALGFINRSIVFPEERDQLPWEIEAHTLAQ